MSPRIVQTRDVRGGFADAAASRPACHVDIVWGTVAFAGILVAIVVGCLDAAIPFVHPSRLVDGIVVLAVDCTEEARLQDSGLARISVDMDFVLAVQSSAHVLCPYVAGAGMMCRHPRIVCLLSTRETWAWV